MNAILQGDRRLTTRVRGDGTAAHSMEARRTLGHQPTFRARARRGVSSVLAMLFLVIFSSLAAAMAVVAQGNLRTADSSLKVSRAQSAAETGLVFAQRRMVSEATRFVVKRGVVDADFADRLWQGNWTPQDGVTVSPPVGYPGSGTPASLAEALQDAHAEDGSAFAVAFGDSILPRVLEDGTLLCPPMRMEANNDQLYFRLSYQPLQDSSDILITCSGTDGNVSRTVSMRCRLAKRIEFAVLSPNRIMVGKNVLIDGPVGTRYGTEPNELSAGNGDPIVMRSDFRYLSTALTTKIDTLRDAVVAHDVDGDGRLRPAHPEESQGLSAHPELVDLDQNQYVDEFDLFLSEFDVDGDAGVVWDAARAMAAGLGSVSPEFVDVDAQLARLIDRRAPDRDGDGDVDASDTRLGYDDGVLNAHDLYAKVTGALAFGVTKEAWELAAGEPWRGIAQGAVKSPLDVPPARFEVPADELRLVSTADFAGSASWLSDAAQGVLLQQTTAGVSAGGSFTPAEAANYEAIPFGSLAAYDYYQRPVYTGITFRDVRIPSGTNALFVGCTFEGVTYVETTAGCTDINWNYAGAIEQVDQGGGAFAYVPRFPDMQSAVNGSAVADTKPLSNSLRFDGCTFLGAVTGDVPSEYTHWRNKVQFTGATRFFIDPEDPEIMSQTDGAQLQAVLAGFSEEALDNMQRSSIFLPGWSVDVGSFANEQNIDPDLTPRVKLKGTVIAGVMDVRGSAEVHGTLLLTYRPATALGPLFYGGAPEAFNTTLGYFGPLDGDGEGLLPNDAGFLGFGEIRLHYDPDAKLPDGIPWPITAIPQRDSYREGGGAA